MKQYREEIAARLPQERQSWHVFDTVDSTNLVCKRMAAEGAADGTVVIADGQTAGRGRLGRSFQSVRGLGLYLSVLWRPATEPQQWMALPALGAVAAVRAIARVCGLHAQIKWPNDLVLQGKKVGGILTESVLLPRQAAVVLGIGINVAHRPEDFDGEVRDLAASLELLAGRHVDRAALAAALVEELDILRREALEHPRLWLEEYRQKCLTVGREVQVIAGDAVRPATALAVDEEFGLTVRYEDESVETVRAGEVSVRGLYGYV